MRGWQMKEREDGRRWDWMGRVFRAGGGGRDGTVRLRMKDCVGPVLFVEWV